MASQSGSKKFECLHLLESQSGLLTAEDFAAVWEHFDSDGNGYIEGRELTNFFKDLLGPKVDPDKCSETLFKECVKGFMETYDENSDGKIEMRELAELLKPEENFLLLFRLQQPSSSVEFMELWRKFDKDSSGFIEAGELKNFIIELIKENKGVEGTITDEKLEEYTQTILKLFDSNNDGKLELKEMAKLLPTKENFLKQFQGPIWPGKEGQKGLTRSEFERVFSYYDKDKNGTIEGDELTGFLKDLLEHDGTQEVNMEELQRCCEALVRVCDRNNDGIIQKSELERFIATRADEEPEEC